MDGESGRHGRGGLEVITGCMFSGKSEHLLTLMEEARRAGLATAAFKHNSDNRYDHREIVSHNGRRLEAVALPDASQLAELSAQASTSLTPSSPDATASARAPIRLASCTARCPIPPLAPKIKSEI